MFAWKSIHFKPAEYRIQLTLCIVEDMSLWLISLVEVQKPF